jgi:hypothetical protein
VVYLGGFYDYDLVQEAAGAVSVLPLLNIFRAGMYVAYIGQM